VLHNVVDNACRVLPVPHDGAIGTAWLAEQFGLRRGDLLSFEIREGRRRIVTVHPVDVVDEPLGRPTAPGRLRPLACARARRSSPSRPTPSRKERA
jgi:hypothetical protein